MDAQDYTRALAAALPEAFAGRDLEDEFSDDEGAWFSYAATSHARSWIERHALRMRLGRARGVRASADEPLQRLLDFLDTAAAQGDAEIDNVLLVELLEGARWVDLLADRYGPHLGALLRAHGYLPLR